MNKSEQLTVSFYELFSARNCQWFVSYSNTQAYIINQMLKCASKLLTSLIFKLGSEIKSPRELGVSCLASVLNLDRELPVVKWLSLTSYDGHI